MTDRLYGMTKRWHVAYLCFFLLLLVFFGVLAVLTATHLDWPPAKWAVPVLLMVCTAVSAAWEASVLYRFRARDTRSRE